MTSIDIKDPKAFGANIDEVYQATKGKIDFKFIRADVLKTKIEETDLLFIDTWHVYRQLKEELRLHADRARKYIILHDTTTFGLRGEDGGEGLIKAVDEFLSDNREWSIKEVFANNNGLTVLQRGAPKNPEHIHRDQTRMFSEAVPTPMARKKAKVYPKPDKIKFIVPVPDAPFYQWQVLVQINNFAKMGYDIDAHFLIGCFYGNISPFTQALAISPKIKAHIHLIPDTRTKEQEVYTASLKPFFLASYFRKFPAEKNNFYMYLDPDVIFLEHLNFEPFMHDDIWYESDTKSYLDVKYIKSKGEQLFYEMCEVAGVDPQMVIDNDMNCGGAQYITKNNTADLWDEVWKTSIPLFNHMKATEGKYHPKGDPYPIQSWTSEMWTTNWIAWKRGIKTKITRDLDFHWANHEMSYRRHAIFHNSGVPTKSDTNFCKSVYQNSPFRKPIVCKKESLSWLYVEEIRETEKNFPELMRFFP
jgi:hypothetical protein